MQLEKYISRVDYDSYDDFVKNFRVCVPDDFNFAYDVVDVIAAETPDKTALVWCNDSGADKVISFKELKKYSDKTAAFFSSLGVGRGDKVMLILKSHYEFWYCILALHKIGAVAIPATHMLTTHDLEYRNNSADIKMIVSVYEDPLLDAVDESQKKSPTLTLKVAVGGSRKGWYDYTKETENASDTFTRPTGKDAVHNTDMMILYFTSGTTGFPKMVQHDFSYPLGHILTAKYWQNVQDNGLHYTVADTGWAKAVWGKIYGQWLAGCAVFVFEYERFHAGQMLENICKYGVTSFCAPPTVLRFVIKEDASKYDFSKLTYCAVAGEPLNPEVYQQFLKAIGIKLMEGYGQTEMTVALATYPWMEPKPGSMGKPSPGYHIGLLSHDGRQCEAGEEGQIVVFTDKGKPAGMFEGYYRDDELTRSSWHDGIYYTGDMAWFDEDGYYWFVGRADDVIKSSGYRIGPFEVESALLEHPAVLECAITGVPDPDRGAVIKATIVLAKGYTASDALAHELQEHVKKVTAPYKYPRIVEFVDELPKTISGKIRRVEIRDKDK